MIQSIKRNVIVIILLFTVVNLFAEPSDYGRPSDYNDSSSSFLSLDSTLGFIVFLIVGILCAILMFALGNSGKNDDNSKGCGFVIFILVVLGVVLKCCS